MSFRFTPGCCCDSELGPCKPNCQKLFEGFYNIVWYERDTNQPLTYDEHPSRCKDRGFILTENAYADGSGGGCVRFGITHETKNGVVKFYADPNAVTKDGNARVYEQLIYPAPDYGHAANRSEGLPAADPAERSIVPKDTFSQIRTYSFDGLYHGTFHYWILHAVPFNFSAEPIRFTLDANDRPQKVELTAVPLLNSAGGPAEGNNDVNWAKTTAQYFVDPHTCGVRDLDTCEYRVPQAYDGLFSANQVRTFLGSCASGINPAHPVAATTYFYLRLYGVTCSGTSGPSLWTPVIETFGVQFARKNNQTIPVVQRKDHAMQTFQLDNSSFDSNYNKYRVSGSVDYPSKLLDYTGTTSGQIKASSLMFGSGTDGCLDDLDSVGTSGRAPARWANTDDPPNSNSQRFRGIYWFFGEVCPCGGEFKAEVTSGALWTLAGKGTVNTDSGATCGYADSSGWQQFVKYPIGNLTPSESISYADRMRIVGGHFMAEGYNRYTSILEHFTPYIPVVPKRAGKRLTHLLWCIKQPNMRIRNAVNRDPSSTSDLMPCSADGGLMLIARPKDVSTLSDANLATRGYLDRDKYYEFGSTRFDAIDSYSSQGAVLEGVRGPVTDSLKTQYKTANSLERRTDLIIGTDYREDPDGYIPTLGASKLNRLCGSGSGTRYLLTTKEDSYGRAPSNPNFRLLGNLDWARPDACEVYFLQTVYYIAFWEDET